MGKVLLLSGGGKYGGWKSIRITRTIESIAGSFAVTASDRWDGDTAPWPIAEGDACQVAIDGEVVIDGYVDKRGLSASAEERTQRFSGKDRAVDLVDSSAIVAAGNVTKSKWTFNNVNVFELAKKICEPHGIPVSIQAGLGTVLTRDKKVLVHPGDTCFEVIAKAAGAAGVLVVSDGVGGIVITRAGKLRAYPLVEGQNIKTADVDYDASDRFHKYLISSQVPGTDEAFGDSCRVQATATDEGVRRTNRVLLIRPDKGYNAADSKRRADWEARIRAARAEKPQITVRGWRQPNGQMWPINYLVAVKAPRTIGVEGDLLISQVDFTIDDKGGELTQISLVRPDAFTPEPTATVHASDGVWKELAKGGI